MTNPNNYTTAYLYFATHMEDECDYDFTPSTDHAPCIYDYVCEMEETPLDCDCEDDLVHLLMAYAMGGE